jgi:putative ABC transport system permease protein
MLRNYLKTAIRSLLRHRFFSAINVFGLAVAMSICMGIIMLVADQLNHDRYNTKSDRIFQVTTRDADDAHGEAQLSAASTMRLRQELLDNYTGVEKVVRWPASLPILKCSIYSSMSFSMATPLLH